MNDLQYIVEDID